MEVKVDGVFGYIMKNGSRPLLLQSAQMQQVYQEAQQVAPTEATRTFIGSV